MAQESKTGFRKIFITGLLIIIPVAVTAAILMFLFNFLDNWLAPLVNQVLHWAGIPLPAGWKRIPGLGILATFLLVLLTGLVSTNYLGRRMIHFGHSLLQRIPLVKNVYGGVSQLVKALSDSNSTPFRTVVMLEFPHSGCWTLGFVSGEASAVANQIAGTELVNVYVPAAPIPSQGIYLMVPRRALRVLPVSTEEGFKMLATLGLIRKQEGDSGSEPDSAAAALPAAGTERKTGG